MRVQNCEAVMPSLVLGAATVIAMALSVGVKAADLAYPPPIPAPPQYGEVAPPAVVPPRVIVVPAVPPPVVGPSYGVPPPVAAGVVVAPRRPCAPVCGDCGWQAGCTPYPKRYPAPYESLGPQGYPRPQTPPAPEPYSGQYAPRAYPGPIGPAVDRGLYRP